MAWDMTLAAVRGKYTPYVISENEIGFLVLHIGVGLERHLQHRLPATAEGAAGMRCR
jgi:transcriptional antiterminator